ncbi:MAG TPA: TIGR01906 family membrane protein [Clostridiales bacterium]|nr:TIGR01906 family membrane protein [Clostridiales bacterium]
MKKLKVTDFLIGFIFTLLLISFAVVITINFRPLYYLDMDFLNISASSGYPREEIKANYDALIDYSSPFFTGELSFPTLPASDNGLQHFREVKNIFNFFYILFAITFAISVIIIQYKRNRKDHSYLLASSITAIVLPSLVAIALAIDFDKAFVVFHKIFFNNDYWLFDPVTDPVIRILPATFFLHCALLIILLIILGSIILALIYNHIRKNFHIKYRKIENLKI